AYALWFEDVVDRVGDLRGQTLLYLQTAGEHLDHTRQLAQADDFLARQVGDVGASEERQQVVLTQAVELDIAHHDHLVVLGLEQRTADNLARVLPVAGGKKRHRAGDAVRRPDQAVALSVLAQ